MWKITHTSGMGSGGPWAGTSQGLALVLQDIMRGSKEGANQQLLPSCEAYELHQWPSWGSKGEIAACISWLLSHLRPAGQPGEALHFCLGWEWLLEFTTVCDGTMFSTRCVKLLWLSQSCTLDGSSWSCSATPSKYLQCSSFQEAWFFQSVCNFLVSSLVSRKAACLTVQLILFCSC